MEKQRHFLEMYDSFNDELFRFCLSKTRNRDDALDITQETFMKTWDYLRSGNDIHMVRGFLYRTARNLIIDKSRKKTTTSLDVILDSEFGIDIPEKTASPEEVIAIRNSIEQLKQLPEHYYEILTLRFIQELTLAEIAAIYKESENTISVRIHRALKYAQKLFSQQER